MKETIKELANKYDIQSIIKRLEAIEHTKSIKIGFIGQFSSGKTSLINSILGTKLPVDVNPCTKAITIIEPTQEIEDGNFRYFIENGEKRTFVNFDVFNEIANGGENGVCGIQIPPCKVLPQNCIFIDTPGIHSVDGNEAFLTYSYLSLLDAAIFCIDVTEGTIQGPAINFLEKDIPTIIRNRIIFALTHSDRRLESVLETTKQHMLEQIDQLGFIKNSNKKIILTSNKNDNSEKIYNFIKHTILDKIPQIYEDRKKAEYKEIGEELITILKEKKKVLNYDPAVLNEKINELKEQKEKIEKYKTNYERKLSKFKEDLEFKIQGFISKRNENFANVKDDVEVALRCDEMFNELGNYISRAINKFIGEELEESNCFIFNEASNMLKVRLNNIIANRNLLVMAGTAVATAVAGGLGGVAGNAAEATAGASATSIAKIGKKELVLREVGKSELKSIGGKFLTFVGNVIRDINPLEHIGDWVSKKYKTDEIFNIAREMAPQIATNVVDIIEPIFDEKYFQPLLSDNEECEKALKNLQKSLDKEFKDFCDMKKTITDDINSLTNILR